MAGRPSPKRPVLRIVALALGLLAGFVVVAQAGFLSSPDQLREWVDGLGPAGVFAFIGLAIGLTCVFVPIPLIAGAAGLLFGTAFGTPVAIAALTLGACVCFLVSRFVARESVAHLAAGRPRLLRYERFLERRGFVAVIYARLAPAVPFAGTSYLGGATKLTFFNLAAGTAVGAAPRIFAYTALGGSLGSPSQPEFWIAIGLLTVIGIAGLLLARRTPLDPAEPDEAGPEAQA